MDGTPAWLSETPASTGGGGQAVPPQQREKQTYGGKGRPLVVNLYRILNMGLAVFMAFAGVWGIFSIKEFKLQEFFVSVYILLFAALLFFHEVMTVPACSCWGRGNEILRRYFGFLYGTIGKALFIIFIAFLNLGLENNQNLGMAVAVSLFASAGSMIILYCKYPEWFPEKMPLPIRR
mmetsp:Transcript_17763/g.22866  ORF Transcript_17763/g.22866 Transcript_17763/m.22866 type:complete len:178 (-) Transcript_17763:422-955(-)